VEWHSDAERFHLLVATRGSGVMTTEEGEWKMRQGQCWLIPAGCGTYGIDGADLEILRVYVPA
jgi:mannose-6-phosphate isomerase class I